MGCFVYGNGFSFDGGFMWIIWMLIALVIFRIIVYTIFKMFKKSDLSKTDEALEMLKIKFTKSEIKEDEFESKRRTLRK